MKTFRYFLLAVVCLLGSVGISAQNVDFDFIVDGVYYKIQSMEDKTVSLMYENDSHLGEFNIPSKVQYKGVDFSVISIARYAFQNNQFTSVTVPESVTRIEEYAFSGCHNVTSIVISDSTKYFGSGVFDGCISMESITLPNNLTEVSDWMFSGCKGLKSIVMPDSLKRIGDCAFLTCESLGSITFSEKTEYIGINAFNCCINLKELHFPKSLKNLDAGAFSDCTGLTFVEFPDSVDFLGGGAFSCCESLTNIILPSYVGEMEAILSGCKNLRSVILPKNLKILRGLSYCVNLESIDIPETVTSIGPGALEGCTKLTSIVIPSKVTSIGDEAFWNCTNLSSITVNAANPPSVGTKTFDLLNFTNATLYVPKGMANAYRGMQVWKDFNNIVETNYSPVETYPLYVNVGNGGALSFGDYNIRNQRNIDVVKGQTLIFNIIPDEGYEIERVRINYEDVTGELVNNSISFTMDASASISVEFNKLPVDLVISQADNGCLRMHNVDGKSFKFTVESAEGWHLNTVTFNGEDVTYQLNNNQEYTTPLIHFTSELNVSYEMDCPTEVMSAESQDISVYGNNNEIVVSGLLSGNIISVFTTDGVKITNTTAIADTMKIRVPESQVYIVRVENRIFKLAL